MLFYLIILSLEKIFKEDANSVSLKFEGRQKL